MAESFQPLQLKKFPTLPKRKESKEQTYWNTFEFPTIIKEFSAINYVDISPVDPYYFLITSNSKAQIIAPYTNEIKRTAHLSKENVFGARFRSDGNLMAMGGYSGLIQILNVAGKSVLRNLKGHTSAARVCAFSNQDTNLFSGSDDKTVKCWDIPTGKETCSLKGHQDHIRCGCITPSVNELFISGCYDHTVKIWDFRSSENVLTLDHGAPVECVLMNQNGMICYSAGSNYIKIWDIVGSGGKLVAQIANQQKTITTMCMNESNTRLLSGSLDRHVKVYDVTDDYSMVANIRYPSPILAMGLAKNDEHLVVGMSDGAISIRNRKKQNVETEVTRVAKKKLLYAGQIKSIPETAMKPKKGDLVVPYSRLFSGETEINKLFRKKEFAKVLDTALSNYFGKPQYVVSVLTELARHNAWSRAISGRSYSSLRKTLQFLTRYVGHPQYGKTLIPFAEYLIEKYSNLLSVSPQFLSLVKQLNRRVKNDLKTHQEMMSTLGALEQILAMTNSLSLGSPAVNIVSRTNISDEEITVENVNNIGNTTVTSTKDITMEIDDGICAKISKKDVRIVENVVKTDVVNNIEIDDVNKVHPSDIELETQKQLPNGDLQNDGEEEKEDDTEEDDEVTIIKAPKIRKIGDRRFSKRSGEKHNTTTTNQKKIQTENDSEFGKMNSKVTERESDILIRATCMTDYKKSICNGHNGHISDDSMASDLVDFKIAESNSEIVID